MNKNTEELSNALNQIQNKKDLDSFILNNEKSIDTLDFIEYIDSFIKGNSLVKSEVINNSLISRTYAYQILKGTKKPSRNKVISLCLSCKMNLSETLKCLTLSGNSALYPKNKRDAVIIFAINKQLNVIETNELLYEMNEDILE